MGNKLQGKVALMPCAQSPKWRIINVQMRTMAEGLASAGSYSDFWSGATGLRDTA